MAEKKQTDQHFEIIFRHVVCTGTDRFVQSQFEFLDLTGICQWTIQAPPSDSSHSTRFAVAFDKVCALEGVALEKTHLGFTFLPRKMEETSLEKLIGVKKERKPSCTLCSNHGVRSNLKGHKHHCPFLNCHCERCVKGRRKRDIMKQQVRLRRKQMKDFGKRACCVPAAEPRGKMDNFMFSCWTVVSFLFQLKRMLTSSFLFAIAIKFLNFWTMSTKLFLVVVVLIWALF